MFERNLWRTWRDHVPGHWVRVENSVGPGTPDAVGVIDGATVWVEFKALLEVTPRLGLRNHQRVWLYKWATAGGRAYVFAHLAGRSATVHKQHDPVVALLPGDTVLDPFDGLQDVEARSVFYAEHPMTKEQWRTLWTTLSHN